MTDKYVNKVVAGGEVIVDLTTDTVAPGKLAKGVTAHDRSGAPITGTSTFDADTSDATATASELLAGKIAYGYGGKRLVGAMPNNGGENVEISTLEGASITEGYHDGSGKAVLSPAEAAKVKPENIAEGITILGVKGTHSGETHITAERKEVTPSFEPQTVTPSSGTNYLSEVTVKPIPVAYTDNAAGGQTCTIG